MIDTAFVVTNYNNSKYSIELIESVIHNGVGKFVVIIVDNASDSASLELLRNVESNYSSVKVIYNKENLGYFHGLNIGIHYVRKYYKAIQYLVVGNNDLIFPSNFLLSIKKASHLLDKYPVISPDIVTLDGLHQNPHVIKEISKIRELIYDIYYSNYYLAGAIRKLALLTRGFTDRKDESQFEIAQEIYQGYGACYILGPRFFELFEQLWTPTFMMYEEFFLSKQLESKGHKTYYEPSISVQHHWHVAMDALPGKKRWKMGKDSHKEYRKYIKVLS